MIPDKIYVGVGTLSSNQPAEEYAFPGWKEKPHSKIRNEEYIRKDTLLEWAKEKAEDYKGTANIRRSFEMMIRKIESL